MADKVNQLIINSPYVEPDKYLRYNRETKKFNLVQGRRPAGYVIATPNSKADDDPGIFKEIELANRIRQHLQSWREDDRPGLTGISRRLWQYWNREGRSQKLFYCQLEAIETILFLIEAHDSYKVGISEIPNDGSLFPRWCNKMATGSGKTIVMAMLIAINILNKTTYRQDTRFSKTILVVAPGLTVKSRLSVLQPADPQNYYAAFDLVPADLREWLNEGRIKVINWHMLMPTKEPTHSVVKLGAESDEVFTRRVLGDIGKANNLLVINDEAHHAWRLLPDESEADYAKHVIAGGDTTLWMQGLDRINKTRSIIRCHDLSATPFRPMGRKSQEELLFGWIVSDFGLNDAIEAGLVKTPRIVLRSDDKLVDTKTLKPRLYHIYNDSEVKPNLSKRSSGEPLPALVNSAYSMLSSDWKLTKENWQKAGHDIPPVMITICNSTNTAARIEKGLNINQLEVAPGLAEKTRMLRIDSTVLDKAEEKAEASTDTFAGRKVDDYRQHLQDIIKANTSLSDRDREDLLSMKSEDLLREIVDSVGKKREAGEQIQHVIAVAMLSEGWDTKNVTHIMGLRAFTSQLLCEQVVGRGLRRVNYEVNQETGLFEPEYVNIFGVPFSFLPSEDTEESTPQVTLPQTRIEVNPEHAQYEITWPNVLKIEYLHKTQFLTTLEDLQPLEIDGSDVVTYAELAGVLEGKADDALSLSEIDLKAIAEQYRMQSVIFKAAAGVIEKLTSQLKNKSRLELLPKAMQLTAEFINSDKIHIKSVLDSQSIRRKVILMMNINRIVSHVAESILKDEKSIEKKELVFDKHNPIRSTADMLTWHTRRPSQIARRSHISHAVFDSSWELSVAEALDDGKRGVGQYVQYWAKNDHVGFEIKYVHNGVLRDYIPDFLIKLDNGKVLILEVKGIETEQDKVKLQALQEWVDAINEDGRFGIWICDIVKDLGQLDNVILKHCTQR